jgi:Tfp pilus assembly protein PilZ
MEIEHRHRMRFEFSTPQRLAEELVTALRRGGCFVSTDAPHPQGTRCTIEYSCADLPEPVAVDAVVTWSTADIDGAHDRHTPGMDVDFQAPLRERKRLIAAIEPLI